jgi:glycosyltransferase involved in cell wall biosynthesis
MRVCRMTRFSVIIPVYNRACVVARAVESVLSQTCQDFEIVVVNDGSTDDTEGVLQPYRDRIHYIRQSNRGSAAARNHGIQECRGQYIAFLDSDDRWYPEKLARIQEAILAHSDAGLLYSDYRSVTPKGRLVRVERCRHVVGNAYGGLLLHCFVLTSTVVCKRECFDTVGFFHEPLRRVQDWDMWIRIARKYSFVHVPALLTEYTWEPLNPARASRATIADRQSVIDRALRADPALGPKARRQVLARLAYGQGVEHLRYGRRRESLRCFWDCFVNAPLFGRSLIYLVIGLTGLARVLPYRIRARLRIA